MLRYQWYMLLLNPSAHMILTYFKNCVKHESTKESQILKKKSNKSCEENTLAPTHAHAVRMTEIDKDIYFVYLQYVCVAVNTAMSKRSLREAN